MPSPFLVFCRAGVRVYPTERLQASIGRTAGRRAMGHLFAWHPSHGVLLQARQSRVSDLPLFLWAWALGG